MEKQNKNQIMSSIKNNKVVATAAVIGALAGGAELANNLNKKEAHPDEAAVLPVLIDNYDLGELPLRNVPEKKDDGILPGDPNVPADQDPGSGPEEPSDKPLKAGAISIEDLPPEEGKGPEAVNPEGSARVPGTSNEHGQGGAVDPSSVPVDPAH